jgi:hypothetical protein
MKQLNKAIFNDFEDHQTIWELTKQGIAPN